MTPDTAHHADEYRHNVGQDYCLASEMAGYEAEQEAEDERWEREGRAEMYSTLFGDGWGA